MSTLEKRLSGVLKYNDKEAEKTSMFLSEKFASFADISKIDLSILSELCGEKNALYLGIIAALKARRITDNFKFGRPFSEDELFEYLRGLYFNIVNETVHLITLDSKDRVISVDFVGEGTVNFSGIVPRKLLEIMQARRAEKAILVHNHPGGKAQPSPADVTTTAVIAELFESANLTLICHYIVAGEDVVKIDYSN